jgi:hypothetical protein
VLRPRPTLPQHHPLQSTPARRPAPFQCTQAAAHQHTQVLQPATRVPHQAAIQRQAPPSQSIQSPLARRTHRTACALRPPLSYGAIRQATAPTRSPTLQAVAGAPPRPLVLPPQAHPTGLQPQRLVLVPSWLALASVPSVSSPVLLPFFYRDDAAWFAS